jgi:hypothetical protein
MTGSTYPDSRRGNGGYGRASGPCRSRSQELTVQDASRSHQHGRVHIHVACWNRRLGSKESSIQLPDFIPRSHVGPPSSVPPRHRPTHSTARRERRNSRPRCLYRDVIEATVPVGDTTWIPILRGVRHSVLHFWHPLGHAREDSKKEAVLRGQDHGVRSIGRDQACGPDDARDERRVRECVQRLPLHFLRRVDEQRNNTSGTEAWSMTSSGGRLKILPSTMCLQLRRLQEGGETASGDEVMLGVATGPSSYCRIYHT